MKNKLYLIIILIMALNINLHSQDSEPSPLKFNYIINGNIITNQPFSSEYFQQKKFSLGAQWGAHSRMMKALDMNVNHGWQPHKGWTDSTVVSIADPNDSMKYIWYGSDFYDCRAFVFKPTLYIPIDKRGELITQAADTTKSVFGFSYLRDSNQVLNNPNNTRYNLYRDSINYIDSVVLEKVWVDDGYKFMSDHADTSYNRINGRIWIFSINLRRLDPKAPVILDDPVLTIRLPYTFRKKAEDIILDHGIIKFSTKPRYSIADTIRLKYREDRGFALQDTATNQNYFVITNRMLPNKQFVDNTGRQDITINAMFICDDPLFNNPLIKSSDKGAGINNIDVQITYHGKSDIGINYCRISTPAGYDMLVGKQDSLIQDWFQYHINVVQSGGYDLDGFYGRDEYAEDRFAEQRYKSLLLNKCVISEGAGFHLHNYYVAQENYNVEPLAVWAPSGHFRESTRAPFYPTPESSDPLITKYRLGYGYGYRESNSVDTLNSHYETRLDGGLWWLWFRDSSSAYTMGKYFERTANESATQMRIEHSTYYRFHQQPNYLYGDKYWWANNFPVGNWGVNDNYAHLGNARPHTGEEVRWMLWSSILMGAKGLFYDARCDSLQDKSSNTTGGFLNNIPQKNKYDTMPLDSLIFSDDPAFGVDFIPEIDSAMYIHNYINLDSTAKYLGVPKNRIYYGRKSPKIEMYNLHKWIRANDSLLMNLRLVSAFSKGYRIWRSTDTSRFVDTIMNNYVKLDDRMIIHDSEPGKTLASDFGITTRPINRELNNEPYYEPYDSSFFDIALHRFQDDEDLSSGNFVLSVLNRRTDPLVYFTEVENDEHLLFLTPSEFDALCDSGGVNPMRPNGASYPDTLWQSYYWKRLGAREITIPFNYCKDAGLDYALLHVTELKADETYDDAWPWWRKERFNNTIDTVIGQNSSLAVKCLPGEGKMFKVEIYKPEHIAGNLEHSNQTKFIVYQDGNDTNKVRYHLVYHKPNPDPNPLYHDVMSVFYRRSNPIDINSDNKQIVWEPEICVSKELHIKYSPSDSVVLQAPPSYYPSITVKQEGSGTKAYVVFQSEADDFVTCVYPACYPEIDNCKKYKNPICEMILDVGGANVIPPMYASAIQNIVYGDMQEYGSPMINASSMGNYYAWADSVCGIGVAYKQNSLTEFNYKNYVSAKGGLASHPSINAYSYPSWTENDCSLVWEEREDNSSLKSIYYTKLKIEGGDIANFLPNQIQSSGLLRISNNCLELSQGGNNTFPTIYRQDGDPNFALIFAHSLQLEKIAWASAGLSSNISMLSFAHFYDYYNYTYNQSYLEPITNIVGNSIINIGISGHFNSFKKPSLSQASSYNMGSNSLGSSFTNDFLLNFVNNWSSQMTGGSGNIIYHLRDNYYRTSDILSDFYKIAHPVNKGTNVHLANSQKINDQAYNVWKNSRVYNMNSQDTITSNLIYFTPLSECPECIEMKLYIEYGNGLTGAGGGGISSIKLTQYDYEGNLGLVLPYKKLNDSLDNFYVAVKQDTIFTEWISIDSIATLKYLVKLDDTNHVNIKLQKLSDSSYIDLPAPYIPGSGFAQQVLHLVNGNYDSYRLAMVNSDPVLEYTENYYFDEPFVQDTIYSKNNIEITKNIIDLNKQLNDEHNLQIKCMPNPASEILNVLIYGSQKEQTQYIKLELYNQSGILKWQGDTQLNSTITLPINDLSNGVYLVKASILSDNGLTTKTSKVIILK